MLTIYEVRDAIKSLIAPLIRKTTLGGSTADGKGDRSRGYERGSGDPDYGFPVRRMQHYGFTSWIPVDSEIVSLAIGGATNGTTTAAPGVWKLEAGVDIVPPRVGDPGAPPLGVPGRIRTPARPRGSNQSPWRWPAG